MVVVSSFYDTAAGVGLKETEWAKSATSRGALYGVAGADDFKLTPHPATAYAVNLAAGKCWGHGVWDDSDAVVLVQCEAPAAGVSRWDLIAAHRDWQPAGGGPTSFTAIQGTATKAIPSGRVKNPGVIDDQPLWLLRWLGGQTQPQEVIDLRCWASNSGLVAVDVLALDYLNTPGAEVHIGSTTWRYLPGVNNVFAWVSTGHTSSFYEPLSPSSQYSNDGIIEVNGRTRHVAISINLVSGTLNVGTDFVSLGIVIPDGARTSTDRVFYVPGWFYAGGANYLCNYFVNMQTGEVLVRVASGSVSYSSAVSFDINLTAIQ